jgi:uncharacterized membrane protein
MQIMESPKSKKKWLINLLLLIFIAGLLTTWLVFTPVGLVGKVRAAGYAVCHQIESHSFDFEGRFLPLCARCTGMYLGTLVSLVMLRFRKRSSGTPSKAKIVVLVIFLLAFIVDGVNSTLSLIPALPQLYTPSNLLRLITGLMMGMVIANLLIVLWHQTWWKNSTPVPALGGWQHFLLLIGINGLAGLAVWSRIPLLYFPIAILSTGTIFLLLGMVYCLIWIIIFKKENSFERYSDGLSFLLAGLATAIIQIGLLDLLRFSLTGTWQGFII